MENLIFSKHFAPCGVKRFLLLGSVGQIYINNRDAPSARPFYVHESSLLVTQKKLPGTHRAGKFCLWFSRSGREKRALRGLLSEACHEIEAFLCGTLRDFVMRRFPIGVE